LNKIPKIPWNKFATSENKHLVSEEACNLLDKMLVFDHENRISAKDAMNHPYFAAVNQVKSPILSEQSSNPKGKQKGKK